MRDYLGQELKEGDFVVYADAHGRNAGASLGRGVIESFTPKCVRVVSSFGLRSKLKDPDKVIKIDEETAQLSQQFRNKLQSAT